MSPLSQKGRGGLEIDRQFADLLGEARFGSNEAQERLLSLFRDYLNALADERLDSAVRPKVGASDLVQESLIEAHRNFGRFRGHTASELRAWLKRILLNNLLDQYRAWRRSQKRELGREVVFASAGLHESQLAEGKGETPSEIVSRREEHESLHAALARLPDHYCKIILLRHRDSCTFEEIGRRMARSADAARMLWGRAFDQLGRELQRSRSWRP